MLFSELAVAEKYNYLAPNFTAAYHWLQTQNLQNVAVGSHTIVPGAVTANVQEYTTIGANTAFFETHDAYFDIQYVVEGQEMFGICKRDGLQLKEQNPDNDIAFYEEPAASGALFLQAGSMVVVAPEDAHKPRCTVGNTPCFVRKIVIKVKV